MVTTKEYYEATFICENCGEKIYFERIPKGIPVNVWKKRCDACKLHQL